MTFASPAEFLAHARSSGLLPSERVDELLTDHTLPDSMGEFLAVLKERGILSHDADVYFVEPKSSSHSSPPYVAIPEFDSDELFSAETLGNNGPSDGLNVHRISPPTMSRSTMWTWIALGGFLWLIGFVIFGMWFSGCLR